MPRAEMGSTKQIANQMKSKGLQRLRWYCQACSRQMRDENGFKCHVASESHVRNMTLIGEDPRKAINDFSRQFERDFVQLLRTGHGEKKVNLNRFYQEYISDKEHVHMNATRWASLTEFARDLGRRGVVRVSEDEEREDSKGASGLCVSWVDNSPEALRRQEHLRKRERQDKGDEELEQRMLAEQIRRAKRDGGQEEEEEQIEEEGKEDSGREGIRRNNGEKVVLNFGKKVAELEKLPSPPLTDPEKSPDREELVDGGDNADSKIDSMPSKPELPAQETKPTFKPMTMSTSKPKNVFAATSKKNALGTTKKPTTAIPARPMSEAERIMKEEIERKRQREMNGGNAFKKQRIS